MDTLTNGNTSYGGVGFIVLVLLFWFFSKQNECPNGYCQDISAQTASAVSQQTQMENAIRAQKELCDQNTLIFNQNEMTRNKVDDYRAEFKQDQIDQLRFANQKAQFDNAMLQQQLINQNQFNQINTNIAELSCNCLKKPPFYPYGCTPCPATNVS